MKKTAVKDEEGRNIKCEVCNQDIYVEEGVEIALSPMLEPIYDNDAFDPNPDTYVHVGCLHAFITKTYEV